MPGLQPAQLVAESADCRGAQNAIRTIAAEDGQPESSYRIVIDKETHRV
jgi:hypothetical protein